MFNKYINLLKVLVYLLINTAFTNPAIDINNNINNNKVTKNAKLNVFLQAKPIKQNCHKIMQLNKKYIYGSIFYINSRKDMEDLFDKIDLGKTLQLMGKYSIRFNKNINKNINANKLFNSNNSLLKKTFDKVSSYKNKTIKSLFSNTRINNNKYEIKNNVLIFNNDKNIIKDSYVSKLQLDKNAKFHKTYQ